MSGRHWAGRVTLAVLVVALAVLPAGARARQADEASGSITLLRQNVFRTADQPVEFALRVRTSSPTAGMEVAVSTYRRLRARSEFVNAVEGTLPTRTPADLQRFPLDALSRDPAGDLVVSLTPRAAQDGVYPIRVELRDADAGSVIESFTTFVVTTPATIEADPLDVALVVPVHSRPAIQVDGTTKIDEDHADALAELGAALAARPSLPVTLLPTAETIEALRGSARGADRDTAAVFASAASGRQIAATTYVPTDLRGLVAAGLTGEFNAQLERSRVVIERELGSTPALETRVIDERLDQNALGVLGDQGVTRLVTAEATLEEIRPPNGVTLTARFEIDGPHNRFDAAVVDPGLTAHFARDVDPALAATYLLADMAVLWLDRPGRAAEHRGVVVMPPRHWTPDAVFVDAMLDGLDAAPVLAPVSLDAFFSGVGVAQVRGRPLTRAFRSPEPATGYNASSVRNVRRRLEGFASVVTPDNPELDLLDRMLLTAASSDLRPAQRNSYVRAVGKKIDDQFAQIDMPERRSITLTAREGELPVTVTNRLPYPITVVLTLDSDALDFPAGASRRLELTRENTTERFEVHARGSGSFPVRVQVHAPEGGLLVTESRFTVRSTAVSGVGILLSVGAALFLVVWWASHLRSRRAERRGEPNRA